MADGFAHAGHHGAALGDGAGWAGATSFSRMYHATGALDRGPVRLPVIESGRYP